MENRSSLKFTEVEKMVKSLNHSIELVAKNTLPEYDLALKDSVIQRFEYSIEGIWKLLKYILLEEFGNDVATPKQIIKEAYTAWLIDDRKIFIEMIDKRNRLSHDYHDLFAQHSFADITGKYIQPMNNLLDHISHQYDYTQ